MFTLWEVVQEDIPAWGKPGRAEKLREFARAEPILAGALASMVSKVVSLDWQITGGRNRVRRYHEVLSEAEDGAGWSFLLDRWTQDYLNTDLGGVVELARDGRNGPVVALYNLDSARLTLTGNADVPLRYVPHLTQKPIPLYPGDFSRAVDMPSPDERYFSLGFCAVSRALKVARVLLALYNYEEEQLRDLPPKGVVAITGMTMPEVQEAFKLYEARRKSKEQTTFKGVLWLAAQANPMQPIDVKITPFSTLPDHFDKEQAITLYVFTLSLDFGVDVREFWPASQAGATKAEAEIQHQKALGKGFGRLVSGIERAINWDVLPDGLEFAFDQKDAQDDLLRAQIHEKVIVNVRKLWEPNPLTGAGLIDTDEARRMLVEAEAVPAWLATGQDVTLHSTEDLESEVAKAANDRLAAIVEKAMLEPGEDLVAINSRGEMITIWSSRFYSSPRAIPAPGWPGVKEAPADRPLTTGYEPLPGYP
ncbi:MAG TPA: hypothetical protein G4O02_13410 [Caldilineae bacterium]|nr:hypothetical protein [Caldilineae bacterium]